MTTFHFAHFTDGKFKHIITFSFFMSNPLVCGIIPLHTAVQLPEWLSLIDLPRFLKLKWPQKSSLGLERPRKKRKDCVPLLFHEILFTELRYAALTYTDQLNADCEDIRKRSSSWAPPAPKAHWAVTCNFIRKLQRWPILNDQSTVQWVKDLYFW